MSKMFWEALEGQLSNSATHTIFSQGSTFGSLTIHRAEKGHKSQVDSLATQQFGRKITSAQRRWLYIKEALGQTFW